MNSPVSPDGLAFLFEPIHKPVLDAADAVERVMGDHALFARMLRRFRREYGHIAHDLRMRVARGEREHAHRLAHTLKGASGMIAAPAVHAAACELEEGLRAGRTDLAATLDQLSAAMQALMVLLEKMDRTATPAALAAYAAIPDDAQLLRELDTLLENGDGAAVDLVEQAGLTLQALLGETRFERVAAAVLDFDFEAARAALAEDGGNARVSGG